MKYASVRARQVLAVLQDIEKYLYIAEEDVDKRDRREMRRRLRLAQLNGRMLVTHVGRSR